MSKLKQYPAIYKTALKVLNTLNYFDWKFKRNYPKYKPTEHWQHRIQEAISSPDNQHIDHVEKAGQIFDDYQLMHNGLKIKLGSYYDYGNSKLLELNKGVHEPQEEYVFQEVLKHIKAGGTMLELGAYWSFYSMWFKRVVANSKCYMVEPDLYKMNFGKLNFELNQMQGRFIQGFIGKNSHSQGLIPVLSVDQIMADNRIDRLSILHADIQGFEYEMLEGATTLLTKQQADYIFISTHSNQVHTACKNMLLQYGYHIFADANLDESYAWDGLLVARSENASEVPVKIILRSSTTR